MVGTGSKVIGSIRINGLMVGGLTVSGINDPAHSAKQMLLNPNLNVSEIAYGVGFQSLTEFNRLFRRVVGKATTPFRSHPAPESAASRSERIAVHN